MTGMANPPVSRRRLNAAAFSIAAFLLSSCQMPGELGFDFTVKNATSMTLTVGAPGEVGPGASPVGAGDLAPPITLKPGQTSGFRMGLSRGVCKLIGLAAYDKAGHLIATRPSPICEDEHGHGNTWTIKQP